MVEMMEDLSSKNVGMYFHQQSIVISIPSGKAMIQMAVVFASFERELCRERIIAAQNRARAQGKTIGRPTVINGGLVSTVKYMKEPGVGIKKIANELGCGVGTFYKVLKAA